MAEDRPYTIETQTAGDGYQWRYRRYAAATPARAHVVCIHGIQSHAGWYEHSCTLLSQAGYTVSFLDRRGSGMNPEYRGDTPSFRRLLDDLAEYLRTLRGGYESPSPPHPQPLSPEYRGEGSIMSPSPPLRGRGVGVRGSDLSQPPPHPQPLSPEYRGEGSSDVPVFLLAISWGGKLGVALQRRHPGLVDGLILLCPGFFPQVRPAFGQRLHILWSRLVAPGRLFPVPLDNPELFTASLRWQQFLRDDPLSLHQATARLLIESVRLDGYLRFAAKHVRVPVLLLLAERDRIIDNAATRRFMERFPVADKQVIEYPGAHHTLEFEPDPDRFVTDMEHWLKRHCL